MPPRKALPLQTTSHKRHRANTQGTLAAAQVPKRRKLNDTTPSSENASKVDAYEVPDSGDEQTKPNGNSATGRTPTKRAPLPGTRNLRGTPARKTQKSTSKVQNAAQISSPEPQIDTEDSPIEDAANLSPSKGRGPTPKGKAPPQKLVPINSARNGRGFLLQSDKAKSILSPTKKKSGIKSRKGVIFDDQKIDLNLGTPTPRKRGRPPKDKSKPVLEPVQQPPQPKVLPRNEDEDEPCSICGKPETTKANDILFCDKCDIAVHQKCYGVKTVPKGDWFCRKCSGEEPEPKLPTKKTRGNGNDSKKEPADPQPQEEEESDENDVDSVPCGICGNPDTEPGDDIIFCDNCEFAVHQKCYHVPEIPEGDWLCRKCARKEIPTEVDKSEDLKTPTAPLPVTSAIPDIPNFEEHLRSFQRVLLDRCTGQRMIKLRGQDDSYQKAFNLVEQTVLAGEGNSMLVIGARGCGKTTASDIAIYDFHVVRLNGFIHTDDKLALRGIWRQLARERGVGNQEANKTNYADTMTSLLGLLSRSEEITGEETEEGMVAKSVVFVIDEFDLFATHARQTLLYNLFDIAQARKAPIAVLGLTTRIEVVDLLEKRVKSRFSHRNILLSMPKTLHMFWDICKQGLLIDHDDLEDEGIDTSLEGHDKFYQYWAKKIEHLRKNEDFDDHLKTYYYGTKAVSSFLKTCILPLSQLSASNPTLAVCGETAPSVSLESPDSKLHLLSSLADLDLALLISAARLDIVAHTDTVNFAMAYDEYNGLMAKQRVATASAGIMALGAGAARVWGRSIAAAAWERLISLGLLIPSGIGGGGARGPAAGGLENRMWKVDVALEEIPSAVDLSGMLGRWCKEI
ncbi:uncharacterized protein MKZ38_001155 [Zalerion maritima]|uniref:PHD-type domain-containing protein n=1 Tax=Zalerion maritima TaxID=339359 RepID=A0AAD5RQM1_9PEZI|nr:uncharacterized protein MKZ38_001155 [Zalerion maritima]